MKVLILAALVAFAAAVQFDSALDSTWLMYKARHNKNYGEEENMLRRTIFEQNVEIIKKHNIEADLGLHTYYLGLNQLADWTNEEYKNYLGYRQGVHTEPVPTFMAPLNMKALPDSADWRTKGYVTPVKNQGQCGSCWAFSATGALEGANFKKTGKLQSFSEQQLVDCSTSYGNEGCNGGWMDDAFKYVQDQTKNGQFLDTESCYPYTARDGTCHFNAAATCNGGSCTGFVDIQKGNETDLQAAVATVGPVAIAIDASRVSFQLYRSGIYNEARCSSTNLDHGVLAVGYGTQSGTDYWIVKNSWGTTWGTQGYIMMSRNKNNQCGVATAASYPTA